MQQQFGDENEIIDAAIEIARTKTMSELVEDRNIIEKAFSKVARPTANIFQQTIII